MSVFARSTFSAAGYAAFRPSYPASLFKMVLAYHKPSSADGTALDLGCGPGVVARELAPHFGRVLGVDPSAGMVRQASESTRDPKITFRQGGAEDLSSIAGDATVDLAVAGQAAHWFDYRRAWPELARVVRRGGTLAFWGYKDNILVGFPAVNEILEHFCYGEGEAAPGSGWETMGRYWERPGRQILRDNLEAVVPPESDWTAVRRIVYDPDRRTAQVGTGREAEAAWQRKRLKLGEFEGYVRTFSAYVGWRDAHPEVKSRAEGGEGDLADLLFDRLLEAVPEWKAKGDKWREVEVEGVWGTVVILAKRR
ncbi:methyltransferase domain-containing protein [Colletotrichum zoysiae]|uniref:Methyltransferase domain-containing protein n=1 Tax=Colletotrichum zoysiae TaxID=1216348 RepID=A0AAD9H8R0_9PEZI|nr:methyltransferase domain-containing protein [Colletotrichum zoysiae]